MLHDLVMLNGRGATLTIGDTNIPVCIDTLRTGIDTPGEIECHISGAVYGGARTNYGKCYKGTTDKFAIQRVLFNDPATIVFWKDGTKTVVKCQEGDVYSEEVGLALCFAKKALGNQGNFNNVFKKWVPEATANVIDDSELRKSLANAASSSSIAAGVMAKFHEAMQKKREADNWLDNI